MQLAFINLEDKGLQIVSIIFAITRRIFVLRRYLLRGSTVLWFLTRLSTALERDNIIPHRLNIQSCIQIFLCAIYTSGHDYLRRMRDIANDHNALMKINTWTKWLKQFIKVSFWICALLSLQETLTEALFFWIKQRRISFSYYKFFLSHKLHLLLHLLLRTETTLNDIITIIIIVSYLFIFKFLLISFFSANLFF